MMLPVQSQSVARSESTVQPRDLNQILQPNVEQSARVVNVRQDPVSPTLFRISLEIGNHRLDVMTNRPLAEGLTVLLSRDARGEVALRLPMPAAPPAQVSQAQAQALSQLTTNTNQFVAMIAPESRAQAQQLLSQTQMTALVQPQLTTGSATPVITGNRQLTPQGPQQGQGSTAAPATTATPAATTTTGPTAQSTGTNSAAASSATGNGPAISTPTVASTVQPGSAAANSAAANQTPVTATTATKAIAGQANQGAVDSKSATGSYQYSSVPPGHQSNHTSYKNEQNSSQARPYVQQTVPGEKSTTVEVANRKVDITVSQTIDPKSPHPQQSIGAEAANRLKGTPPIEVSPQGQITVSKMQTTALVQPQLTTGSATPVITGNRQLTPQGPQRGQGSTAPPATTATTPASTTTTGPTAQSTGSNSAVASPATGNGPAISTPTSASTVQPGSAAANNAAANQAPLTATTATTTIAGQANQNSATSNTSGQTTGTPAPTASATPPPPVSGQAGSSSTPSIAPSSTAAPSPNASPAQVQTSQTGATVQTSTVQTPASNNSAPTQTNTAANSPTTATTTQPSAGPVNTQTVLPQLNTSAAAQGTSTAAAANTTLTQTGVTLARVVQSIEPTPSLPNFSRTGINLGGETINIITPRPLLAGQQIEVTRLNEQAVQVRILPPQPVKTMPAEVVEEMQNLMRQAMPLQAPLADSLNQMRALSSGQTQDAVGQVVRSLMSLFSLTPQTKPEASAKQVEQMMQQSGLFTENRMARQASGQPMGVDDLRTRLGQLRRASQELPPQVREQMNALIDKAEARATHHQISSARQWRDYPDGSSERYFRMDLPLQTPEGFKQVELELREQRRPTSPTETQTNWTLNLHFDLDPIGAVDARVHLEDEWDVSVAFWAESTRTTEMIRDRIDSFATHLQQQGFQVDTINVRKGRAPNDLAPAISRHLVDVHT